MVQEFRKIEARFKYFKHDICKTLEAVEQRFDPKLSTIAQDVHCLAHSFHFAFRSVFFF